MVAQTVNLNLAQYAFFQSVTENLQNLSLKMQRFYQHFNTSDVQIAFALKSEAGNTLVFHIVKHCDIRNVLLCKEWHPPVIGSSFSIAVQFILPLTPSCCQKYSIVSKSHQL